MENCTWDNILKGIPKHEWLIGKTVRWIAFKPPSNSKPKNGWYESSINWEIDEGAIAELFSRKNKEGSQKYEPGIARVPREEIERIINQHELDGKFGYNYKKKRGNDYHGNLLFHDCIINAKGIEKGDKAQICSALSRAVTEVIKDEGI